MKSPLRKKSPGLPGLTSAQLTDPCMNRPSANGPGMDEVGLKVDDLGVAKDTMVVDSHFSVVNTFEPFIPSTGGKSILYLTPISLEKSYDSILNDFREYGVVKEIRVRMTENFQAWEVWVSFSNSEEAGTALSEYQKLQSNVNCFLVETPPGSLDVYYPCNPEEEHCEEVDKRSPQPARWLIVSSTLERIELNYKIYGQEPSAGA